MNVLFWIVAGGVAGWIAYAFLGLNHSRGTWVCVVIGAVGAIVGGMLVAPLFVNPPPGSDFSLPTLVILAVGLCVVLVPVALVRRRGVER